MAQFEISKVMDFLPHRYPFLLIDRVIESEPDKSLSALKNVTGSTNYARCTCS